MSRDDYLESQRIVAKDYFFCGIIMAAMRQADSTNAAKLEKEWPEIYDELKQRYNAPGGFLPGEK